MDKILICLLAVLTAFGFSGVATLIYFFWLWSGFVKTEWTTLSSFTALLSYWLYGFTGLIFMVGAVFTTICALAMFWFDMSLQDIQDQAKETVNDARPEGQKQDVQNENNTSYNELALQEFYKRSGMTEQQAQEYYAKFLVRYQNVSSVFDGMYNRVSAVFTRTRELTDEIPFVSFVYYYYDLVMNEVRIYLKAILSLKELSKLSRQGFGQNNGPADFSALQNIDMNALLGGLEAFGLGQPPSSNTNSNANSNSTSSRSVTSAPRPSQSQNPSQNPFQFPMGNMGNVGNMGNMGGMGGFDMAQMAELERNMTPQQKKQAEDAAMSMLKNMDLGQMGDMMKMFGMGNNMPNPQNLNRAQRKKLKKMQKNGK